MAIYELENDSIKKIAETTFSTEWIQERGDLQRILRDSIDVIGPDMLVIDEEFSQWEDSSRRIDLLGLDKEANLVVLELKRTDEGGHMELQAIRYAAMISTMTFERVVDTYAKYIQKRNWDKDAQKEILDFLGWVEPDEEKFAQDVRIVLVSGDFSKEITTAVMWLNERDLNIRCVRLKPYKYGDRILLDVQQVIPLPEASEYQVRLKEKGQAQRASKGKKWDEESFMKVLREKKGPEYEVVAKEILKCCNSWFDRISWGEGRQSGSCFPVIDHGTDWYSIIALWSYGSVEIQFQWLAGKEKFKDEEVRRKLLAKFNRIEGVNIPADGINRRPSISLVLLAEPENMKRFKEAV
ncbi:MAG: hypothetical protein JXB42_09895, partial [Deltaproteobacteria bacterium]|nr:hypothetical protein [Deltaproteobacteria bacterium]